MKKSYTTNTFNKGIIMDLNPIVTPNDSLVNCLNGTLITYNGNENVLQNDMGNGRVETAYLPQGYVPLGTAELGGIMYIVSYNPITKKSQIGSFPSPERNITTDDLITPDSDLSLSDLYEGNTDFIRSKFKKLILLDDFLHPGDKFQIASKDLESPINIINGKNIISGKKEGNTNPDLYPRYLKLNVVAIQDNGIINNLNKTLIWHDNNYYILGEDINKNNGKISLDEYRNVIQSNYNIFNSKVDGKLAILAEFECIDDFSISWTAFKKESDTQSEDSESDNKDWNIYFYLNWTYSNKSSSDKINLYGLHIEETKQSNSEEAKSEQGNSRDIVISNYPKSNKIDNNDILYNEDTSFYTPMYVDDNIEADYENNNGITALRRNDGTDNDFFLDPNIVVNQDSESIQFDIYPTMPFGILKWMKQSISINVADLGSGKINLTQYKYYYNSKNNITLNWGLEAYVEKNKKINSLKFEYYEYNNSIGDYITKYETYIQNDYTINNKWSDGTENEFSFSPSKQEIISKDIRSGNDSKTVSILDDDKLYLVRIVIDYNGEQEICYYRFMYTFAIFNDKYHSCNDFKNIVLNDTLKNAISINTENININNINKEDKCIDSSNNEITSFEQYIDKEEIRKYNIKRDYSSNIEFDTKITTNYPGLSISIKNIEISKDKVTNSFSYNDIVQKSFANGSVSSGSFSSKISSKSNISNISLSNSSHINLNYSSNLSIPIEINYNNLSSINAQYQLTKLIVHCKWLLIYGRSKHIDLLTSSTYNRADEISKWTNTSDDSSDCRAITSYENVSKSIKNELSNCDILALRFRVCHDAKAGSQGNYTICGTGSWHKRGNGKWAHFDDNIYYDTNGKIDDAINLPLYCFLDNNDNVQALTFGLNTSQNKWYNINIQSQSSSNGDKTPNIGWNNIYKPIRFTQSDLSDDILRKPFEKYYRITNSIDTMNKYKWSRLFYYSNGTWKDIIYIPLNIDISLIVNNTELKSSKIISNLNYNSSYTNKVDVEVSNYEDFNNWIDKLIINSSTKSIVKLPNGSFKEIEVSTNSLYDSLGNKINYVKKDNGQGTQLSQNKDSTHKLLCQNNRIILRPGRNDLTIGYMGRQEEQSVAISDIIQINSDLYE